MGKKVISKTIILGAGGFGREVADTLRSVKNSVDIFFLDDSMECGAIINGIEVLGKLSDLPTFYQEQIQVYIGIANPDIRKRYIEQYSGTCQLPPLIHPTAVISDYSVVSDASIIQAHTIVANNSIINPGVVLNAHSGIGHDVVVGSYSCISGGCDIAGGASLGESSFMGTGSRILPNVNVGDNTYICAGSVVMKNVENKGQKIMGNPSKIIGINYG